MVKEVGTQTQIPQLLLFHHNGDPRPNILECIHTHVHVYMYVCVVYMVYILFGV